MSDFYEPEKHMRWYVWFLAVLVSFQADVYFFRGYNNVFRKPQDVLNVAYAPLVKKPLIVIKILKKPFLKILSRTIKFIHDHKVHVLLTHLCLWSVT